MSSQTAKQLLVILLISAVLIQACNVSVAAPTPIPIVEPTGAATAVPSATPTPSASLTPTEHPTASPEPIPEFFAGFTQNEEVPFLLLHRSGETAATLSTENESGMTGAVWASADRESSLVVYSDSNGLPQQAMVGQDTLFFSNYSGNTLDMTVVHADGSEETIPVELDTALLDMISTIRAQSLILVSYPSNLPKADWLDEARQLLSTLGALECLKELTPPSPTLGGVFRVLREACKGEIIKGVIKYGEKFGLNAGTLEEIELHIDMGLCVYGLINPRELPSCGDALLLLAKQIRDFAEEANREKPRWIQYGTFKPGFTEPPVSGVAEGTINGQAYCRYGPGKGYLEAADLFQGDRVTIDGRYYGNNWLWVKPEKLDRHCWVAPSVLEIVGDVGAVEFVSVDLPFTTDANPVTGLIATRDGNMVTIAWDPSDLAARDLRGYLLEVQVCQNGAFLILALNPQENFITIQDEEGCSLASSGVIYIASVRGYSQPVQIPWPK